MYSSDAMLNFLHQCHMILQKPLKYGAVQETFLNIITNVENISGYLHNPCSLSRERDTA